MIEERVPPQNIEAEQAVLGAMLIDKEAIAKATEVLSADAFSKFEEDGVLNAETGRAFREAILARGGSQAPMVLFVDFRGREPSIDALLRHSGLREDAAA